jgi:hypothetical protein
MFCSGSASAAAGMRMVNVAPCPKTDSAVSRPPCASTRFRAIDSPRPVPPRARARPRGTTEKP